MPGNEAQRLTACSSGNISRLLKTQSLNIFHRLGVQDSLPLVTCDIRHWGHGRQFLICVTLLGQQINKLTSKRSWS